MSKLSDYQKGVVDDLPEHGGELRRIPGGFWVAPDCKLRISGSPGDPLPYA